MKLACSLTASTTARWQKWGAQFGAFRGTDRRPQLWAGFAEFVREVKACGVVDALLVDGSFVTAEPAPNDIDLALVVSAVPGRCPRSVPAPGRCLTCLNCLTVGGVGRVTGFEPGFSF